MKKLNLVKFKELSPCIGGYEFVLKLNTTDLRIIFDELIKHDLEWANWLVARLLSRKDRIRYAVFAAQQVLDIYEKEYPKDLRPRQAIEAAILCIDNNTKKNRDAALAACDAAWAAGDVARAAWAVLAAWAVGAAGAAWDAAWAAWAAGDAAWAAWAAGDAGDAARAARAAWAAGDAMKLKIVAYGLELLGVKQ